MSEIANCPRSVIGSVKDMERRRTREDAEDPSLAGARRQMERHVRQSAERYPGPNYFEVLKWIHSALKPDVYLEIGVGTGASLMRAQPPTRCIAIDPDPQL